MFAVGKRFMAIARGAAAPSADVYESQRAEPLGHYLAAKPLFSRIAYQARRR